MVANEVVDKVQGWHRAHRLAQAHQQLLAQQLLGVPGELQQRTAPSEEGLLEHSVTVLDMAEQWTQLAQLIKLIQVASHAAARDVRAAQALAMQA